jgi:hypothetical protein
VVIEGKNIGEGVFLNSFDCQILYKITFLWFSKTKILVKEFFSIRLAAKYYIKLGFFVLEDKNIGE